MNVSLPLAPDVEQKLRQCVAASGQAVEQFVLQAVQEKLAKFEALPPRATDEQERFRKKLEALIELLPTVLGGNVMGPKGAKRAISQKVWTVGRTCW